MHTIDPASRSIWRAKNPVLPLDRRAQAALSRLFNPTEFLGLPNGDSPSCDLPEARAEFGLSERAIESGSLSTALEAGPVPEPAAGVAEVAAELLGELRAGIQALELGGNRRRKASRSVSGDLQVSRGTTQELAAEEVISSSGSQMLDRLLPEGGFLRGSLVEWLSPGAGSGAGLLALIAAIRACRPTAISNRHSSSTTPASAAESTGVLVVVDRQRRFYPPAALRWGISPEQLVVVQPQTEQDERWALDQALRSPAVNAVWASLERVDERSFRRFQLAAERSGVLGMLVRPAAARGQPSWSEVQLWIESCARSATAANPPSSWAWQVEILRCRGGTVGQNTQVRMDETTGEFQEARNMNSEVHRECSAQDENASATQTPLQTQDDVASEISASNSYESETDSQKTKSRSAGALRLASQLAHPTVGRRSARA